MKYSFLLIDNMNNFISQVVKQFSYKYTLFTYRNIAIQIMNVREYNNFILKHQHKVQDNGMSFVIRE